MISKGERREIHIMIKEETEKKKMIFKQDMYKD